MFDLIRRYRWPLLAVGAVGLAFVLIWFQPQALLIDTAVDDDFPAVAPPDGDAPDPMDGDDMTSTSEVPSEAPSDEMAAESGASTSPPSDSDAAENSTSGESSEPQGPILLSSGVFQDRSHPTSGAVSVYEVDGERVLRIEDLQTENGPDLYVYLSAAQAGSSPAELDADIVNLGRLKGNLGNQNYAIPADVDLSTYRTVMIWCERFTVVFGDADLT